jgi:hypothetical protein
MSRLIENLKDVRSGYSLSAPPVAKVPPAVLGSPDRHLPPSHPAPPDADERLVATREGECLKKLKAKKLKDTHSVSQGAIP